MAEATGAEFRVGISGAEAVGHVERFEAGQPKHKIVVADVRWLALNPATADELGGGWQTPDLSKVDEVGVTTLRRGVAPGNISCAQVAWIGVIGNPVPRVAKSN